MNLPQSLEILAALIEFVIGAPPSSFFQWIFDEGAAVAGWLESSCI